MKSTQKLLSCLAPFGLAFLAGAAWADATPAPLALRAAQDYAQLARYPHSSIVIEAGGVDPLLDARQPSRQSRLGPNGAGPRLTVWASTVGALPGAAVTLFASLTHTGGAPSLVESAPTPGSAVTGAKVGGELIGRTLGALGTVTYRDDGRAPDTLAGDGIYTARYTLPARRAPALGTADSVMVKVDAVLSSGELRRAAGGFQFSNPAARLTGRYTDAVRDGNLVVAAELEVLAPGRVHLSGTLADALGQPFAAAQAAKELAPGKQWLELSFYGLAFHDRQVSGAVSLASVALASTTAMPNALGPVTTNVHTTRAYELVQFTRLPFDNPDLVETSRRLQADALRAPTLR
ncbi:MAG: hypothetical protein HYV18_02565 [Gammaproteobacteria bacterium]|nr:hypothetical protein [Gammaproteobacteria bacterium]